MTEETAAVPAIQADQPVAQNELNTAPDLLLQEMPCTIYIVEAKCGERWIPLLKSGAVYSYTTHSEFTAFVNKAAAQEFLGSLPQELQTRIERRVARGAKKNVTTEVV